MNKDIFVEFPLYGSRISIRLSAITAIEEINYGEGRESDCLIYCGGLTEPATLRLPYEKAIERIRDCVDDANRL